MFVEIDNKMLELAQKEAKRRDPYINHHFSVQHLSENDRDIIGFLGEFAACSLLNINWQENIRENYLTIDNGDGKIKGLIFDVKTETIPEPYFSDVIKKTINDDRLYGRRLIHQGQVSLLHKYQIIIFGAFKRNDYSKWFPIGFQYTENILSNYTATTHRPDGGYYPFAAMPIKTSDLIDVEKLMK